VRPTPAGTPRQVPAAPLSAALSPAAAHRACTRGSCRHARAVEQCTLRCGHCRWMPEFVKVTGHASPSSCLLLDSCRVGPHDPTVAWLQTSLESIDPRCRHQTRGPQWSSRVCPSRSTVALLFCQKRGWCPTTAAPKGTRPAAPYLFSRRNATLASRRTSAAMKPSRSDCGPALTRTSTCMRHAHQSHMRVGLPQEGASQVWESGAISDSSTSQSLCNENRPCVSVAPRAIRSTRHVRHVVCQGGAAHPPPSRAPS
jgi:hypothetical protein